MSLLNTKEDILKNVGNQTVYGEKIHDDRIFYNQNLVEELFDVFYFFTVRNFVVH